MRLGNTLPVKNVQKRWLAENLKNVTIPFETIKTNTEGGPCLETQVEQFVANLFRSKVKFSLIPPNPKADPSLTRTYLCHLYKSQSHLKEIESWVDEYEDELQEPL